MSFSPTLDKMVNEFRDYAFKDHVTEDAQNHSIKNLQYEGKLW